MRQAEWKNIQFLVTDKIKRTITSVKLSCAIKTATDSSTGETSINGRQVQKASVTYASNATNGCNPRKEFDTLQDLCGETSSLLIGEYVFGADTYLLKSVSMNNQIIDNNGLILSADITLNFEEVGGISSKGDLKVKVDGTDITKKVAIHQCILEEYSSSHADILKLEFSDPYKEWGTWSSKEDMRGMIVEVEDGLAKSGKLYIHSVTPSDGVFTVMAMSIPLTAMDHHNQIWKGATLEKIAKDIADRNKLGFKTFYTKKEKRTYVKQNNEPDFTFLQKRCELEGAAFLVYNGDLTLFDEKNIENKPPKKKLNLDNDLTVFTPCDKSDVAIKTLEITNGEFTGKFTDSDAETDSCKKITLDEVIEDEAAANKIASSLCRLFNKNCGVAEIDCDIQRDISAGSVIKLETGDNPSWNVAVFVMQIRHNFVTRKSKITVRKVLKY